MNPLDNEELKERALRRALTRTLREGLRLEAAGCPDPDTLAAYFEHALEDQEASRWEPHVAACARCQQVLAAMAVSEPAAEVEPTRSPPRTRVMPRLLDWRWLAPVGAAAAAVILWIAIRQGPIGQENRVATGAPEAQNEIAQYTPSAPPELADKTHSQLDSTTRRRAERPKQTLERAGRQAAVLSADAGARPVPAKRLPAGEKDKAERLPEGRYRRADEDAVAMAKPSERAAEQPITTKSAQQVEENKMLKAREGLGTAGPPSAAAMSEAAKQPVQEATEAQAKKETRELQKNTAAARATALQAVDVSRSLRMEFAIAAPTGRVLWRVGPKGRIEHSRDAGRNWQWQASGVQADLLAGSAPLETICWVVGRSGTILRTTDGEHWEKIPPPVLLDWVGVEAHDIFHARVSAASGQSYLTTDGGRTWRLQ